MNENNKTNDSLLVKVKKTRKRKVIDDDLLKTEIERDPIKYTSKGTVRMSWIRNEEKIKKVEMDRIIEERAQILSDSKSLKDSLKQKKLEIIESIKQKNIEEKQAIKQQKIEEKRALKQKKIEEKQTLKQQKIEEKIDMRGKTPACRAHQKNLHSAIKKKFIEKSNLREQEDSGDEEITTTIIKKRTRSRTPESTYRNRDLKIIPEEQLIRDLQRNIFKGIL